MGGETPADLKKTPFHQMHIDLGAKMVPFAGYDMPVQYPMGVLKEHLHTREQAGLFDVSHMGQAFLHADDPDSLIEELIPGDIKGLEQRQIRYSLLLNEDGGILDDLMITKRGGRLYLVVNAACKDQDFAHISAKIGSRGRLEILDDRALLALQGPKAVDVLARFIPAARHMLFMTSEVLHIGEWECFISRSGYTGEDGYEISIPNDGAEEVAQLLLGEPEVAPIGLGARDSLRLEAGLCLYGSDIDTTTTPVEGNLNWTIGKRRREERNFPGADKILDQIANGAPRKRVGIRPEGKAPARAHTQITNDAGEVIGEITSGGFGPSYGGPVAMGYVASDYAKIGTEINLMVRGKAMPARVEKLPFVQQRYFKG